MHSLKREKLNLNTHSRFAEVRDGSSSVMPRNSLSLSVVFGMMIGILGVSSADKSLADGVQIYLGNSLEEAHPLAIQTSSESSVSTVRFITVQNESGGKSKESFGWSMDLPEWQGLPDTRLLDKTNSPLRGKANKDSAEGMYDRFYTQFLVGDLDAAEEGFLRITRLYPQSAVAYRAQMVIKKIAERRSIKLTNQRNALGIKMPSSSVEQLFSISQFNNQFGESNISPVLKNTGKVAVSGSPKGTRDEFINNIGDRIFFEAGSAELTVKAKELLLAQVRWLKKNPEYEFLIEGHADEEGSPDFNMALSANRAGRVQQFFVEAEIDPGRIKVKHFGKKAPVATCKKEDCSIQNRRVVTRLLPPPGKPEEKIEGSLTRNFRR